MASLIGLEITGVGSATQAASEPQHLVRLGEMEAAIAEAAPPLGSGEEVNTNTATAVVVNGECTVDVRLHGAAAGVLPLYVAAGQGIGIPFGSGAAECAPGDHTHAVAGGGDSGFMTSADKDALDALVAADYPLLVSSGGTAGTAVTAARSDHSHPVATAGTDGLMSAGSFNSLAALLAQSPLELGLSGGNSGVADTAAREDHQHAAATTGVAGFMSAADKTKLNASVSEAQALSYVEANYDAAAGSDTIEKAGGHLEVKYLVEGIAEPGKGALAVDEFEGLYVMLGSAAEFAAPGNHVHAAAVSEGAAGFMTGSQVKDLADISTAERGFVGYEHLDLAANELLDGTYPVNRFRVECNVAALKVTLQDKESYWIYNPTSLSSQAFDVYDSQGLVTSLAVGKAALFVRNFDVVETYIFMGPE